MTGYYQRQRVNFLPTVLQFLPTVLQFLPTVLQFLPTVLQRRFFKALINNRLWSIFPAYNLVNIMN